MIDQCITFCYNANKILEIWNIASYFLFYAIMISLNSYPKGIFHSYRTNWSIATWKLIMKICNKLMKLLRKIILDCEPERKFCVFSLWYFVWLRLNICWKNMKIAVHSLLSNSPDIEPTKPLSYHTCIQSIRTMPLRCNI